MEYNEMKISDGVSLIGVPADRFKTNHITVSLAVPLKKETAAANSLLAGLLARRGKNYPNMLSLNKKLAELYGASVTEEISKIGENQVISLNATCLDDKFSLDSKSIAFECVKLLTSLVFEPRLDENGFFFDDDIAAEKRILIEKIESEKNEKRLYVLRKAESLMFENEPYGLNKYGTAKDVEALTAESICKARKKLLETAKILVTVIGKTDIQAVYDYLKTEFSKTKRQYTPLPAPIFIPECKNIKRETERIDVKQGKLVIGFRVNVKPDGEYAAAMRSFCDIFGGGPYSKLFANVREKMSLCYYCSARYTRLKSCILIQCGCLEENMDKAVDEILRQLSEIKIGNFKEEFESSRMALRDAAMSVNDTPEALESWYINQIGESKIKSPADVSKEIDEVTFEQIKQCAALLSLDTVYKLVSEGEK